MFSLSPFGTGPQPQYVLVGPAPADSAEMTSGPGGPGPAPTPARPTPAVNVRLLPQTVTTPPLYLSINILCSAVLFICIFVTGTAFTTAVSKQLDHNLQAGRFWIFAVCILVVTLGLAIGFGELSRINSNINVNVTSEFSA